MARPPRAMPMALPRSSSSVYTLASMPIPKREEKGRQPSSGGTEMSIRDSPPSPTQTCGLPDSSDY